MLCTVIAVVYVYLRLHVCVVYGVITWAVLW